LRVLAVDYGVAHTTLSRYFRQPQAAKQLRELRRRLPAAADGAGAGEDAGGGGGRRRYQRLTGAELALIADWHVRGASDAVIACELGCERSSVRRARARPLTRGLIAAGLERQTRREQAQFERADRRRRRQAALAQAEREAAQPASADRSAATADTGGSGQGERPQTPAVLSGRAWAEAQGLVRLRNPEGTLTVWREKAKADILINAGWHKDTDPI
jgi:hypothetical protein